MALIRTASAASAGSGVTGASLFDSFLPDPRLSSYASQSYVSDPDFAWGTQVDDTGLVQVLRLWEGVREAPAFTWWNSTLTDSAMHAGGPGSEIARAGFVDTDRRLGVFLDHLEAQGVLDETVFLLTADHGFETSDPSCRGGWDGGLKDAGLTFRDEGAGFIYLGES